MVKTIWTFTLEVNHREEALMSFLNQQNIQIGKNGSLRHFLTIEGLSREQLTQILDTADSFLSVGKQAVKKVPLLRGKTIANLFFEASTRTRSTFELAAKRLSADVLNINVNTSSTSKGESLMDTLHTLEAMHCEMFILRHQKSGAAHFIAQNASLGVAIVNAGDGGHAHPTQAMLDMLTIRKHKGDFRKLKVAIVGDIRHSRVARSQIQALAILGVNEIRVIGPKTLLPKTVENMGVHVYHDMKAGLQDMDVVMMLRLQKERMQKGLIPSEHEYYHKYGLTREKLKHAKEDAIVMHPGPINRGVEIESQVADGSQSLILQQVSYGIAVRMAIMSMVMGV